MCSSKGLLYHDFDNKVLYLKYIFPTTNWLHYLIHRHIWISNIPEKWK